MCELGAARGPLVWEEDVYPSRGGSHGAQHRARIVCEHSCKKQESGPKLAWFGDRSRFALAPRAPAFFASQGPVTGGEEIQIRFAIWDTGDQALDSTAVIDNFQWIANGGTVAIGTIPIPDPQ